MVVYRGEKSTSELPGGGSVAFDELLDALHRHWLAISDKLSTVEDVKVIGIDLTKRTASALATWASLVSHDADET